MFYDRQPSPTNNWPSNVQYPTYQPDRRLKIIWFLALALVALILSVTALIIVFSVEHAWFSDSFNQTNGNLNYYGLWRLCFYSNRTCDSWFSTDGRYTNFISDRLNQAKAGINAWQALEIVFLFLTASTLIITSASVICYRFRPNIHYYLAILAVFCAWPAACIGISGLFVFGFSVFNVSPSPHNLEWCFYVNIVAVILSIISAILLTVYDILLKGPMKSDRDDTVMETFTDANGYPTILNPSTFVVVKRNKKKRKKPEKYPQILYPNQYFPPRTMSNVPPTDYITNPNYQMLGSYTQQQQQQQQPISPYRGSGLLPSPSAASVPPQARYYQPPITTYRYPSPHWHRTEPNPQNYNTEPANNYIQRGLYRPTRLNPVLQREEPRILHYYTGYDHFSSLDPSDVILTRHHSGYPGRTSPSRHTVNPSYYQQNDYIKSAM